MKKLLITVAVIGMSSAAFAEAPDIAFATADADSSGGVSLAEAQAVWSDLDEAAFKAADTSQDGFLDQAEFDAYAATQEDAE